MHEPDRHVTVERAADVSILETLRASVAGSGAVRVASSALTLFHAGGRKILGTTAQAALRAAAERGAARAMSPVIEAATALPQLGRAGAKNALATPGSAGLATTGARAVSGALARTAAREVLRGASRAAAIGFVVDGAIAGVEAVIAVRNGSAERDKALVHVAKEAASGAIATGAGVLVGAGLVAVTGGLATPVVFAASAAGSIGVKRYVRRWLG